jgi:hypothetical protein
MEDKNDVRSSRLHQWMFRWRSCVFFLETAEHFMCCANTCEVLKAVHILESYVWKNSQNTKNELCRRHALQLSYLFTQIDSKTVIVPIVVFGAWFASLY